MAITFLTANPAALLKAFDDRIAQSEPKGKITTWEKLADGVHYTHRADSWKGKAFLKPKVENGRLVFNIITPKDQTVLLTVYGYYHGHLIETFLNHFDKDFTAGSASAMPETGDLLS